MAEAAFFSHCLPAIARDTERLPVGLVPEELPVAFMSSDVVNHLSRYSALRVEAFWIADAKSAFRLRQPLLAALSPPRAVETFCSAWTSFHSLASTSA
jgi:hypothetical protein